MIPAAPLPRLALVWEPGNDHTTFVASEVPMPWLDEQPLLPPGANDLPVPAPGA